MEEYVPEPIIHSTSVWFVDCSPQDTPKHQEIFEVWKKYINLAETKDMFGKGAVGWCDLERFGEYRESCNVSNQFLSFYFQGVVFKGNNWC